RLWWWITFLPCAAIALFGLFCIGYQISNGVGVWGENHPAGWAWDITNFVFWIGIGHAGTLISAILFLTRQKWRTSINRAAEAMTIFAVICAAIFPGIHVGRVWMAWFLAPIPNANGNWPNFRSPLLWDVFAVSTYFTVSALFWYTGMVPDLATLRDRAKSRLSRFFYGVFALGWRGSNRNWRHYEMAYLLLAGLSTPLVLSVHSVVSFDFATSILPGWHTTIFPPYFVAGAIFGGFAMVLTILLPSRLLYPQLDDLITRQHVDKMAKIILLTGSIVGYAYLMELFIAYYGANKYELFTFLHARAGIDNSGWYSWAYYCMMFANVVSPQVFWMKWARNNYWVVFAVCMIVNAGMWFERFVIIVTSLAQDFLPSSWGHYTPSWVEIWTFIGTFGIFLSLFLLFMKFLPMIAMSEVKLVIPGADPHNNPEPAHGTDAKKEGAH
ncbi:MAG: NrfD/PsrC family molybdoenzyme membrane anchor subunit, partial [Chthoniobacteraceae bacterium]